MEVDTGRKTRAAQRVLQATPKTTGSAAQLVLDEGSLVLEQGRPFFPLRGGLQAPAMHGYAGLKARRVRAELEVVGLDPQGSVRQCAGDTAGSSGTPRVKYGRHAQLPNARSRARRRARLL